MIFINSNLKIATFGGTHEKEVGAMIEGFPAGYKLDMDEIQSFLDRRKPGTSDLVSGRKEDDLPKLTSGINDNVTTGDMIRVIFENKDVKDAALDKDYVPRPGHGDFTYFKSTGTFLKGATSARPTVGIAFAGAMCKQYLAEKGIFVSAKLVSPSEEEIRKVVSEKDSIGGLTECNIVGLPAGFNGPYGPKLESLIGSCVLNLPGVRGIEFGLGFEASSLRSSEFNDPYIAENGSVRTATNNCGGILGGMATGSPVVFRTVFKPTASIGKEMDSVNLMTLEPVKVKTETRNDPCIAIRGTCLVEAAAAIAVMDICLNTDY